MIRFFSNCLPFLTPSFLPSPSLYWQLGNYSVRYEVSPVFGPMPPTTTTYNP